MTVLIVNMIKTVPKLSNFSSCTVYFITNLPLFMRLLVEDGLLLTSGYLYSLMLLPQPKKMNSSDQTFCDTSSHVTSFRKHEIIM